MFQFRRNTSEVRPTASVPTHLQLDSSGLHQAPPPPSLHLATGDHNHQIYTLPKTQLFTVTQVRFDVHFSCSLTHWDAVSSICFVLMAAIRLQDGNIFVRGRTVPFQLSSRVRQSFVQKRSKNIRINRKHVALQFLIPTASDSVHVFEWGFRM